MRVRVDEVKLFYCRECELLLLVHKAEADVSACPKCSRPTVTVQPAAMRRLLPADFLPVE